MSSSMSSVWVGHNQTYLIHNHRCDTDVCQRYYIITLDQNRLWAQRTDVQTPDNLLKLLLWSFLLHVEEKTQQLDLFCMFEMKIVTFRSSKRGQTPVWPRYETFSCFTFSCVLVRICMFMVLICKREFSIRGLFAYTLHTHTHTHTHTLCTDTPARTSRTTSQFSIWRFTHFLLSCLNKAHWNLTWKNI